MRISQKRIRLTEKYLTGIANSESFYIGLIDIQNFSNQLIQIGFNQNSTNGEQVLPSIIGRITRFNANGGLRIRRDLPMETKFREVEIKDWHGNYHTVDIPYKRYPREPISAPNVELSIRTGANNNLILSSQILINERRNFESIKHIINLFLEIFGECEVLQENLLPPFNINITRLNWDVLPAGNYPWTILAPRIQNVIDKVSQHRRILIQSRIQKITSFNPNFVAVGRAGFHGYIIFGFPHKNFFILESVYTGNATYVLGQDWQQLSQLTKEQILTQNLHQKRIVHLQSWSTEIDSLLR